MNYKAKFYAKLCLRSKLYSIDCVGGLKQSAKGVQKSVKKTLHHDLFRHCLFSKDKVVRTMTQLRSHCHQIVVNEIDKVAVNSFNDKRFLLDNAVSSLAYGHYKIGSTFSDTTDRQTGRCFKMFAILWFLQPQSFRNSLHFFFCLDYSNGYDSSSVYSDSTFFTSSSCSSTTDLSRRITARQWNLVALCMICSKHYLLLVSCGKARFFFA